MPGGRHVATDSDTVVKAVAAKLREVLDRHGPRAVAMYSGTGAGVSHPVGVNIARAFFRAIQSRMVFSPITIDKPAEYTAVAMHGNWHAGLQTFETSDTWMIVGANPVIAKSNGAPAYNPGVRLKRGIEQGMKLIVIDPRATETARRAALHLQCQPGQDAALLAGFIHVILRENLLDAEFVARNAIGLDALTRAVEGFTPSEVSRRACVPAEQVVEAARMFARGRRGGVICSTGPSFSTRSNLSFYLALCLNTLCGRWAREGDVAPFPNVLLPAFTPRAQPYAPYPVTSDRKMRVHGLTENVCGMPTAALADEILEEGDGQVRILFCLGGNPVLAWPDQLKTEASLKKLELLVVLDYQMSATARFAHYVVPPPLSLEVPGSSQRVEALKYHGVSRGYSIPWAQYTDAVAAPPVGADLMDDGTFFFRLAQELGLQLDWTNIRGQGNSLESATESIPFDMSRVPSVDDLIEFACSQSRVPLQDVKRHPHGHVFDIEIPVQPRDPACTAMLQLGDPRMMGELCALLQSPDSHGTNTDFPYLLLCRRANNFMNSVGQSLPGLGGVERQPPAFMHPEDMVEAGLLENEFVRIRSRSGYMVARLRADAHLRRGLVSVVHGFGAATAFDGEGIGALGSVTRLISMDERDPISGIPRMSALPVSVERHAATRAAE
jgi:anaerobic selenocysteine-containing dehydrogenase